MSTTPVENVAVRAEEQQSPGAPETGVAWLARSRSAQSEHAGTRVAGGSFGRRATAGASFPLASRAAGDDRRIASRRPVRDPGVPDARRARRRKRPCMNGASRLTPCSRHLCPGHGRSSLCCRSNRSLDNTLLENVEPEARFANEGGWPPHDEPLVGVCGPQLVRGGCQARAGRGPPRAEPHQVPGVSANGNLGGITRT